MATLELSIDQDVAVSPIRRTRRLGPLFWAAIAWMIFVFAAAALASLLPFSPTDMDMLERRAAPSALHWLGNDGLGRDELARLVYGARISLTVGLCAPVIGLSIGGALGMLAGYFRGRFETYVVGSMDVLLAFPPLILALAVTAYLGQSILNLTCILGVLGIPAFMRVARASTLTLARREFVIAAEALGATHARILLRELLPNVLLPLFAFFLLGVAVTIVVEGALSFLGLGVPPPAPSWGSMIGEGRESLDMAPWLAFLPDSCSRRCWPSISWAIRCVRSPIRDRERCEHRWRSTPAVGRGRVGRSADAARGVACGRQRRPQPGAWPHLGRGGRIGLRQDHAVARHPAIAAQARPAQRAGDAGRPRPRRPAGGGAASAARAGARRGLPGPDDLAQSRAHHRHPDHRDAAGPSRHGRGRRCRAQRRAFGGSRHPGAGSAIAAISPSALRRHAPKGGDRHRAQLRAQAPDRRRADHGARRHGAGADPRPVGARAAAPPHGDDPDHARSRRRRRPHRRGGRDVCRTRRRARADAASVQPHAHALHRGAVGRDPQARFAAAHALARDRRPAARSDAAAGRLFVRAALPLRRRALPVGQAAAGRSGARRHALRLLASARPVRGGRRMTAPLLSVERLTVEY